MASTSSTNAAAQPRTTSDDDERGTFFFLGRWLLTLVAFGFVGDDEASDPGHVLAHAAGHP